MQESNISNGKAKSEVKAILKEPHHGLRTLKRFSLNFSSSAFVIHVNLLHP